MNKIKITLTLGVLALLVQSCFDYDNPSDEFSHTEIITDDNIYQGFADTIKYDFQPTEEGVEKAEKTLGTLLKQTVTAQFAMRGGKDGKAPVPHAYQYQFCLTTDCYAQYFVIPHFDFYGGKTLTSTYNINRDFNSGPNGQYGIVKNGLTPILNHPDIDSIPELKAIYLLLFNYASQEQADLYGPFPYFDFKRNKMEPPFEFNDVRSIYYAIVDNIKVINDCLLAFEKRPQWYKDKVQSLLNKYIKITKTLQKTKKGVETYRRFANSLKLRMAMHIVKVEPKVAQKWAEEAIAEGVIETTADEVAINPMANGVDNPLGQIANTWHDITLSASFESLLKSLNHPYIDYLFAKNTHPIINQKTQEELKEHTRVVGMRSGAKPGEGQNWPLNPYIAYSRLDKNIMTFAPLYLMKISEVDFLRAEGVVRGWNMGGTAEFFYRRGMMNGYIGDRFMDPFKKNNCYTDKIEAYMEQTQATHFVYKDPQGLTPDMPSVTHIGVKWNGMDTQETKLEKIITQKYIALFPYSFEAWTELRRTGYPRVFPVLHVDDGDGSLAPEGSLNIIRRMIFPGSDDSYIKDIKTTGIKALGGADLQATRLWWDADVPNF